MVLILAVVDAVRDSVDCSRWWYCKLGPAKCLQPWVSGASAVQIGTRFVMSQEASSHPDFKNYILKAGEGDTKLTLKSLMPVRLLKNPFFDEVEATGLVLKRKPPNTVGKRKSKKGKRKEI